MNEIEAYIRQSAMARGIDPNVAVAVAKSEGGLNSWNRQSDMRRPDGSREQSYGPFQLYMGGGLGNQFQKATGYHPSSSDPAIGRAGIDFAMDQAKAGGWGPWYGAKKIGVTGFAGINGNAATIDPGQAMAQQGIASLPTVGETLTDVAQTTAAATAQQQPNSMSGIFNAMLQERMKQAPQLPPEEDFINRNPDQRTAEQKVAATSQTPNAYLNDIKRRYL